MMFLFALYVWLFYESEGMKRDIGTIFDSGRYFADISDWNIICGDTAGLGDQVGHKIAEGGENQDTVEKGCDFDSAFRAGAANALELFLFSV